jgi:hypothetical protein
MFEDFECECVYVEVTNDRVPNSGRVEFRARLCDVCQAHSALLRADGKTRIALASGAPRYQRMH